MVASKSANICSLVLGTSLKSVSGAGSGSGVAVECLGLGVPLLFPNALRSPFKK